MKNRTIKIGMLGLGTVGAEHCKSCKKTVGKLNANWESALKSNALPCAIPAKNVPWQ